MPELVDLVPWEKVAWDNMSEDWNSGGGEIIRRPYFYRDIVTKKGKKLLIISAVKSKRKPGAYHAVDYLRLSREALEKLVQVGRDVWG